MITIEYIRVQAKKDVDEISEEAEYRNIPGEVRTPEYENETRIEEHLQLKNKPFNPNSTKQPVTCVEVDKSPFDSVDVECCSIESLKPKLPTPESSSLSGGLN